MKKMLALLLAACPLLAGCDRLPTAREMGDMALLRTVGVDAAPAGVAVTGSTGPRAKGLQAEGEAALVLTAERPSLSGACMAMRGQSGSYVFFGYVDQLLIGGELAERGVLPVLDYFAQDVELGLGAQLWLVRNASARDAVSAGGDEGVDRRLETLLTDSEMGIASLTRTAGEVYTDLLELGCAYVPALSPTGDETAAVVENGYGVLKDGVLAGFLDGEAARGLELLAGGPSTGVLEVELQGRQVSARMTSARTRSRLEFQSGAPSALKLDCEVEARLTEYQKPLSGGELERLRAELEARERARLNEAVERLRDLRADCVGLGARAAMVQPAQWQAVQAGWPDWFARIPVEITVEVKINS